MKMTKIATALSLALLATTATAADSADVYGSVRIALDKNENALSSEDKLSRFGVKGSKDLGDGLTAVGRIEYGINMDQGDAAKLRLAFVGLKGSFGEIYHGSQTTVWHKYVRGAYFSNGADSLRQYTIRDDGLTQYYYKADNFSVGFGVQTEDKDGNNIDTIQAGAEYKVGGFKGQVAYVQDKNGDNEGGILGVRAWYNLDNVTLSAFMHSASEDFDYKAGNLSKDESGSIEDTQVVGAYAAYKFGQSKVHGRYAVSEADAGDRESIKVEYVRHLDKAFQLWTSYEQRDDSWGGDSSSDLIEAGVRYDF